MKKVMWGIFGLGVISFIVYLVLKHMDKENSNSEAPSKRDFNEQDAKEAIENVEKRYGKERAKIVEKILRAETGHFKSQQYKKTGSAGMLVSPSWGKTINELPIVSIHLKEKEKDAENKGDHADYYRMPSVTYFAYFLSDYIDRHKGDFLAWRSTSNKKYRNDYQNLLNNINTHFA